MKKQGLADAVTPDDRHIVRLGVTVVFRVDVLKLPRPKRDPKVALIRRT